jgi:Na+-driven multidrug efflux pump
MINFLDSVQTFVTGIIRGIGKEIYASICFIVCYPGIGLIGAYIFAYPLDFEVFGVYIGQGIGLGIYLTTQLFTIWYSNWQSLSDFIQARVDLEENITPILLEEETTVSNRSGSIDMQSDYN